MIRGSDGLDYEDLGARLLGEPARTDRNHVLSAADISEAYKTVYREAYDRYERKGCPPEECHHTATAEAGFARWLARNDFGVITTTPSTYF